MPRLTKQTAHDAFQHHVLDEKIPVLINFTAPWCAPCHVVHKTLQHLVPIQKNTVRLVTFDIVEFPEFKSMFGIGALPSLVLMTKGKESDRLEGVVSATTIAEWLDRALLRNQEV